MSQQGAAICVLQLEDADQRLHESRGALHEDLDCTRLQLPQPWAALEAQTQPQGRQQPEARQASRDWAGAQKGRPRAPRLPASAGGALGPVQGREGRGFGTGRGLTWGGPGCGRACSQRFSSRATQASREGPLPRQPRLPSSMSRSPASGSASAANPLQASSWSCGDTRPRCRKHLPAGCPHLPRDAKAERVQHCLRPAGPWHGGRLGRRSRKGPEPDPSSAPLRPEHLCDASAGPSK